jgi:ribonuclease-3
LRENRKIMKKENIKKLEEILGYTFTDKALLDTAFSHRSFINECMVKGKQSYERLEFLGDAILEYVVSEYLFTNYTELTEGQLTKLRSSLVCEFTLSKVSRELGYGDYIQLSKGERITGGANRDSILCDLFESVLGAVYLDGGIEPARSYVLRYLLTDIEHKQLYHDSKTRLQELVQKNPGSTLRYEMVREEGPEHDKTYYVRLLIDDKEVADGSGHNKKNAEQEAAYKALQKLL